MNQFKSGTLLVIAATVITAIFILMTDRDQNVPAKVQDEATIVESDKSQSESELSNESTDTVAENSQEQSNLEQNTLLSTAEPIEIKAPEGPYNNETNTTSIENDVPVSVVPETKENKIATKDISEQAVKLESIKAMPTSAEDNQAQAVENASQPIWMDQKLGDFKSIENGDVVFNLMPTNPNGLQGENPETVVTTKDGKIATTAISKDYNYQQMPMYNGGYYIAPMPQYLMPSILPKSIQNIDQ